MNECLYCKKEVNKKYCNVSCQNKHQNSAKADKKFGEIKKHQVKCYKCGENFEVEERDKVFPKREKYYCSRSCSNSRNWTEEDKKIKSEKNKEVKKFCKIKYLVCLECNETFIREDNYRYSKAKFCSLVCSNKNSAVSAGLASANKRVKRSKNEIHFAELCEKEFNTVLTNENIFNGWDADVIIEDLKIAVMWNGKWHYDKITESHKLKQVQNRDKIKVKEIKKLGYKPYVIKDMGRENKKFVEEQFELFLENIKIL